MVDSPATPLLSVSRRYGSFFAAARTDGASVRVYGSESAAQVLQLTPPLAMGGTAITAMTLNEKEDVLACVYGNRVILLWELQSEQPLMRIDAYHDQQEEEPIFQVACHPSDLVIATMHQTKAVLWDVQSQDRLATYVISNERIDARLLAFSPDGRWLIAGGGTSPTTDETQILIWELESAKLIQTLSNNNHAGGIAGHLTVLSFDARGRLLITGWSSGLVDIWDVSTTVQHVALLAAPFPYVQKNRKIDTNDEIDRSVQTVCFVPSSPLTDALVVAYRTGLAIWSCQPVENVKFLDFLPLDVDASFPETPSRNMVCGLTTMGLSRLLILTALSLDHAVTWRLASNAFAGPSRLKEEIVVNDKKVDSFSGAASGESPCARHVDGPVFDKKPPLSTQARAAGEVDGNDATSIEKLTNESAKFLQRLKSHYANFKLTKSVWLSKTTCFTTSGLTITPELLGDLIAIKWLDENWIESIDNVFALSSLLCAHLPNMHGQHSIDALALIDRLASKWAVSAYANKFVAMQKLLSDMADRPGKLGVISEHISKKLAHKLKQSPAP